MAEEIGISSSRFPQKAPEDDLVTANLVAHLAKEARDRLLLHVALGLGLDRQASGAAPAWCASRARAFRARARSASGVGGGTRCDSCRRDTPERFATDHRHDRERHDAHDDLDAERDGPRMGPP